MHTELAAALVDTVRAPEIKATQLWKLMTWREKLKWWIANRLTGMGQDVRDARQKMRALLRDDYEASQAPLPRWAVAAPKTQLEVSCKVALPLPLNYVESTIELNVGGPK